MKIGLARELLHVAWVAALKEALSGLAPELDWVHDSFHPLHRQLFLDGDACYPFKKMVKSSLSLLQDVAVLLVPRIVGTDDFLMCPNFRALPDIVQLNKQRYQLAEAVSVSAPEFNVATPDQVMSVAMDVYHDIFNARPAPGNCGAKAEKQFLPECRHRDISQSIALIAHPYVLKDARLNNGVPDILKINGRDTVTVGEVAFEILTKLAEAHDYYAKKLYWRSAREIFGGFIYFTQVQRPAGIIQLVPFNCGVDALLRIELASLHKNMDTPPPYMVIVCDEHTQRDHVVTRVEAFLDIVHGIAIK